MPTFLGLILIFIYCTLFIISLILVPFSIIYYLLTGNYYLIIILIFYYIYRLIFPAQYWPLFHLLLSKINNSNKYCNKQILLQDHGNSIDNNYSLPKSNTLLCWHPHGIMCLGWGLNGLFNYEFISKNNSKINYWNWLGTDTLFILPFYSDLLKWAGSGPCSKLNFIRLMKLGANICLLPGGMEEQDLFEYNKHEISISYRAGFIKYSLQYNYSIYPIYSFGEELTYHSVNFKSALSITKKYHIPMILARGWFGSYLPIPTIKLITIIGKPIKLPLINNPTNEDIEYWHSVYINSVQSLFDKYKIIYGNCNEDTKLTVN